MRKQINEWRPGGSNKEPQGFLLDWIAGIQNVRSVIVGIVYLLEDLLCWEEKILAVDFKEE